MSPTLTAAARDVESYDAKVTAASGRASAAADASSKAQATAAERVVAANTRTASSSEAMSAKIAASQAKAAESSRALAEVSESSAARSAAAWSSLATKGLPLAAAAIAVVTGKMAGDFQQQVVRLETTAGESQKNLGMVSRGLLDMAGQVGVSATELARGMYTVESAGFHGADALKIEKAAAQGAAQENADLAKVTDAVTTALHDYNLPAKDAAKVTSEMVTAVSHGKTTFDELTGSLHSLTPLASALHIPLSDILGDVAAMTASGESADQSTQNLADALRHLQNPTSQMTAELAQLGITSSDLATDLSSKGLSGTVQEIADAIVHHLDPATQKVLLPALNQSRTASQDLNIMLGQMPSAVAKLSRGLMDGSVSIGDYRKEVRDLGGQAGPLGMQFLSLYQTSQGFNNVLKAGGPAAQTYSAALAKAMGDSAGLTVALQLTGEHAATVNSSIKDISKSSADARGNIKGWDEVQGTFNQQLHEAEAGAGKLAIELGQHVLPAATATFGWIAHTGVPAVEHLGSAVGGAVHEFTLLPAPVKEVATALAAIKVAEMVGLWTKLTAIPGQVGGAMRTAAANVRGLSDKITVQQALFAMEQRNADAAALSVERLGQAEKAAATWAASAATADEAAAAAESSASARRLAAINQLTAGARNVTPTLSGAQQTMAQWDKALANEAPAAADLANGGIGRFRAGLATLESRAIPAVKSGLSGLVGLLGGPWGLAIIGATLGISALSSAFARHDAEIRKDTDDVKKWSEAIALGGGGTSGIAAQKHLDDLKQKIADVTEKINEYNAAAAGGYARGGIGSLISQQKELQSELDKGTKAWKDQLAGMTPVQVAQERLTLAQQDLNDALKHNPPTSQAVIVAESNLAEAQHQLGLETDNANRAAKTQIQQQQDQADKALALVDSQRQAQEASLALTQQVSDYNSQVADGTLKGTALQQATLGIVDAAEQAAKAAGDAAAKQAAQNGATDTGAASQAAFMKSLQDAASTMTGPAKKALEDYIAQLGGQQSQAQLTAGAINALGVQVTGLPDSHLITINVPTDEQMQKLRDLGYATVHLPNGQVVVSADTNPAISEIQDLLNYARQQSINYRANLAITNPLPGTSQRMGTYAAGGYTGDGGKYTPAGVVHAGEFVFPQESVNRLGVGFLGALAGLPGYAGGGWVNVPPGGFYAGAATMPVTLAPGSYKADLTRYLASLNPFAGYVGGGNPYYHALGQQIANALGVGGQFSAIDYIFSHESGWNPQAQNPTSTAYGIPQFLNATWAAYGGKTSDPATQIRDGIEYMINRYGSPNAAAQFWAAHHWYKDGTNYVPSDQLAVLHRGEAVVPAAQNQGAPYQAAPSMPGYGTPFSGAHFGPTGPVNVTAQVRVFLGDREITDIVRVEATAVVDRELGALADIIHYAGGA